MSNHDTRDWVDEVRAIRRRIVAEHGNDIDRLCEHLKQVERDYRARAGAFAAADVARLDQVIAGWGDEVNDVSDALIDEVRAVRAKLAKQQRRTG
jgi:hypothetical protein